MITISRDQNRVNATFDTGIGFNFTFYADRSSSLDAELLRKCLNDKLNSIIEEIRREAYNTGWKDKSAKRTKRTWFNPNISSSIL